MAQVGSQRTYHVVVWGSTGLVGRLVLRHIAQHYQVKSCCILAPVIRGVCVCAVDRALISVCPLQGQIKWAMAGRNREKLEKERDSLAKQFPATKDTAILTGNAENLDSLQNIASQTKVLISTSGPYAKIGNKVVEACVVCGTHYCDITGQAALHSFFQCISIPLSSVCTVKKQASQTTSGFASPCFVSPVAGILLHSFMSPVTALSLHMQNASFGCRRSTLGHANDESPSCRSSPQGCQNSPLLWV